MSEDPRFEKLRELEREVGSTTEARVSALSKSLANESDRGCVIIGATLLEDQLEALLRAYCLSDPESVKQDIDPLFDSYSPFATFQQRSKSLTPSA